MSRYTLRSDERYEVVVGYDAPLDSFFAQVYDVRAGEVADDDVLIVWAGTTPQAITDAATAYEKVHAYVSDEDLAKAMATYSPDDPSVIRLLNRDREARRLPTEFQREAYRRITGGELP